MPTSNIIGYLWSKRQELDLDGVPDVLQMVSDLQRYGLECVRVVDMMIFGVPTGSSVQLMQREDHEWAEMVNAAILDSSVSHAMLMLHEDGDPE